MTKTTKSPKISKISKSSQLPKFRAAVARVLDDMDLAISSELACLQPGAAERHSQRARQDADAAWDEVLRDLGALATTPDLGSEDARLATLCDRLRRHLEGDDAIDPSLWRIALRATPAQTDGPGTTAALLRRGADLACAYGNLLALDPCAL